MSHKYSKAEAPVEEQKIEPTSKTLKMLFNYSRSFEVKISGKQKIVVRLN